MDTITPNNFVTGKSKVNQKPLTKQDIDRLSRFQRGKLIIALSEAKQPLNIRQLSIITGIERPTMCRRIAELTRMGLAKVVRYGICPISGYPRVGFYAKGGVNG